MLKNAQGERELEAGLVLMLYRKKLPKDWYNATAYIPECIFYTDAYTIYNFICNK